jgi:F-type H+-transporting ATPase subunit a
MDKLHEQHWIVQAVNAVLDPLLRPIAERFGVHADPGHLVPDYLAMSLIIVLAFVAFGLFIRTRLSVERPSRSQIVLEDLVLALAGMLDDWIGPKGRKYLPLIGALGGYILVANYAGLVPGLMAPTANINVPAGCAITIWVYYHVEGLRTQGLVKYVKHFAVPPGAPAFLAPLMLIIEPISHLSRVLSLTLRLFGNIFGEEMVIAIIAMLAPYLFPLPMMALALITGLLQAFIFVLLSVIYLQGAVVTEHDEAHAHGPDLETAELAGI